MDGILGILNIENMVPIDQSLLGTIPLARWHRAPDGSGINFDTVRHHLRHGLRTVNEDCHFWKIYNPLVWREGIAL